MGVAFDHRLASVPGSEADPFDLVGSETLPSDFLLRMFDLHGRPAWLVRDTGLKVEDGFPARITVREYITMIGNLHRWGPDPAYYIPLARSGVPLFAGNLDIALKLAPDLHTALDLLPRYAKGRPGFFDYAVVQEPAGTALELRPMTALGDAAPALLETWFLWFALLAMRHACGAIPGARIELAYPSQDHHHRLAEAAGMTLQCEAKRNAILFPGDTARRPSLTHDAVMWRAALQGCDDEMAVRHADAGLSALRALVVAAMDRTGKVPRLAEIASMKGVSSRTLIRRLGESGLSYQAVVDDLLKRRAVQLLAHPANGLGHVASETGFSDTSAFHRSFRRWFGTTPAAYRATVLNPGGGTRAMVLALVAGFSLGFAAMENEPGSADRTWLQSSESASEEEARLRT